MLRHWTCSKFADWLRGTEKPYALEWDAWDVWREEARKAHPIRWWLTEVALDRLQAFIFFPKKVWRSIDAYFHNRFVDRTHLMKTGLKPGQYYEFEDRVLHGLFTELVDFVEVEGSMHYRCWNDGPRKPRRSKEWGLKYLEWEMSLKWGEDECIKPDDPDFGKPTHQAVSAAETMALYKWWTETRPNRPDPYDSVTVEEVADKYLWLHEQEEKAHDEDTEMMCRLIKQRRCLWT